MSLPKTSNAGLPVLPFKPTEILLPYGDELESIKIIHGDKIRLGEGFIIEPGQAQIAPCFNMTIPCTPPNASIYNSTEEFPSGLYTRHYLFRTYAAIGFFFWTYILSAMYQNRARYGIMKTWLRWCETKARKQPSGILDFYRGLPEDRTRVLEIVDNPEEIVSYDTQKPKRVGKGTSIVDPSEDYDYVVITSKALNSSNGDYTFQDLVAWKNQKGVKATSLLLNVFWTSPPIIAMVRMATRRLRHSRI